MNGRAWRNLAIFMSAICLMLVLYIALSNTKQHLSTKEYFELAKSDTSTAAREIYADQVKIDARYKRPGRCLDTLVKPVKDSNYIKLVFSLKGKELHIMDFDWNGQDYVSGAASCIDINSDKTEHTMAKYIRQPRTDSIATFFMSILSDIAGGNEYEFSIKAYDIKGTQIASYPEDGSSIKGKISAIALPAIIKANIKLKK